MGVGEACKREMVSVSSGGMRRQETQVGSRNRFGLAMVTR